MWMSAHMRRGDFAIVGWVMEKTVEAHFERIRAHLDVGRDILRGITVPETHISGVDPDIAVSLLAMPLQGDPLVCTQSSHAVLY